MQVKAFLNLRASLQFSHVAQKKPDVDPWTKVCPKVETDGADLFSCHEDELHNEDAVLWNAPLFQHIR